MTLSVQPFFVDADGASSQSADTAPSSTALRTRRRWRSILSQRLGRLLPPTILGVGLLTAWQLYVTIAKVNSTVLPSPARVATAGWKDRQELWDNMIPTLQETLLGFTLSITLAWLLAVVCDFSKIARRAVEPLLVMSQTIPIVAIAPLFVIWFGFTMLPKVLVVALVTFFPITVALLRGFASTADEATSLLVSMGANAVQRFVRLRVPTSLPFFFSGLRISITYAVVGAVFGEYVGAERGLGIYMLLAKNSRNTDHVLAAVAVTAIVSLALYFIVSVVEGMALRWERPPTSQVAGS